MAEQRVVVEPELGVERNEIALPGHHQRVDLDERGVELGEGAVERIDKPDHRRDLRPRQAELEGEPAGEKRRQPGGGIDRLGEDLFRCARRQLLDFDAAFGRPDQRHAPQAPVDRQGEVELARDVAGSFDVDPLDLAPLRPGLMGHQRMAD